jgi:hypothetical protein
MFLTTNSNRKFKVCELRSLTFKSVFLNTVNMSEVAQ